MSCTVCPWLMLGFGLLGLAGVVEGLRRLWIHRSIPTEDPTPVVRIGDSERVAVEGRVRVADDTLAAPVTGRESVLADWSVQELFAVDEEADLTVAEGIDSVPFVVDDGTGDVLVDAGTRRSIDPRNFFSRFTTANLRVPTVLYAPAPDVDAVTTAFAGPPEKRWVDTDDPLPDDLREFDREAGIPDPPGAVTRTLATFTSHWGDRHGDRTYVERTLEPGDQVYVYGAVDARVSDAPRPLSPDDAVIVPPHDGVMVISTRDHETLTAKTERSGRRWLYGGLTALAIAAASFVVQIL